MAMSSIIEKGIKPLGQINQQQSQSGNKKPFKMAESSHYSDRDQIKVLKDERPLPQVIVSGRPPLKYNNTTIEKQ